jgi:hypothetical protein
MGVTDDFGADMTAPQRLMEDSRETAVGKAKTTCWLPINGKSYIQIVRKDNSSSILN